MMSTFLKRFPPIIAEGLRRSIEELDSWKVVLYQSFYGFSAEPTFIAEKARVSITSVMSTLDYVGIGGILATLIISSCAETCSVACDEECKNIANYKECYDRCFINCMDRCGQGL